MGICEGLSADSGPVGVSDRTPTDFKGHKSNPRRIIFEPPPTKLWAEERSWALHDFAKNMQEKMKSVGFPYHPSQNTPIPNKQL